ncbi:c-type cytochrome [Oleiagrimonas sp.]|jgi:cytochrome c|uniref:c-type cytochrome n=1 Tax=Oleiagrimonas sp. TaxID=2010330 RepID=UPI0026128F6D|nr:c-type cytochrome [Oleiagrimonas sp.]MDA3913447.1 hypothetical protein [Oleiagrimonas sp.]
MHRLSLVISGCVLAAAAFAQGPRQMHPGQMGMHGMMGHRNAPVPAQAPPALRRFACMSCHAVDKRSVGPAFAWVAWRYRDQTQAEASLAAFIEHGGQGHWSGVMPDLNVPANDARAMAKWILALPAKSPPE